MANPRVEGEGKMSNPTKKWTSEEDDRLLGLKAQGLTLRLIAKSLNRTGASVDSRLRALRRNGNARDLMVEVGLKAKK
jgi:hypothetical protein